jgi:hypothetical protein
MQELCWGTWGLSMKLRLDRVISIATLLTSLTALFLVMKRPAPVAPPSVPAAVIAANAQSFQNKIEQLEQAQAQGQSGAEVRLNAQEISAAIAQAAGALSAEPGARATTQANASSAGGSTNIFSGDLGPGEPDIKNYQVNFEGDLVKGQFLSRVAGKDVWITLEGHLGSKDGYATFEPTKFKVGDLSIPVSLVNDQLQKKLLEQRDQLKLPESVGGLKVENGEVVVTNK